MMELTYNIYSLSFWQKPFPFFLSCYMIFWHKFNFKWDLQQFAIFWTSLYFGGNLGYYDPNLLAHLENCIRAYNVTTQFEQNLDLHFRIFESDGESLRLELEGDMANITVLTSSMKGQLENYYNLYLNRGYYLPLEIEKFQREVVNGTVSEVNQILLNMESKKTKLWNLINGTFPEIEGGSLAEVLMTQVNPDWFGSLSILYQGGVRLSPDPKSNEEDPSPRSKFEPSRLFDLNALFHQLHLEKVAIERHLPVYWMSIRILGRIFDFVVHGMKWEPEFPVWDLNMNRIPSFLEENSDTLAQFLPWLKKREQKINNKRIQLYYLLDGLQTGLVKKREKIVDELKTLNHMAVQVNSWPVFPDELAFLEHKYGIVTAQNILQLRRVLHSGSSFLNVGLEKGEILFVY